MEIRTIAVAAAIWAATAYGQINIGGNPITLPGGKRVGMGRSPQDTEEAIEERKAGFRAAMRRAEENFEKKAYGMSREAADAAMHLLTDKPDVERLVALLEKLEVEGAAQLKQTRALLEAKKYRQYLRGLRRIAYEFGKLPCAKRARALLMQAADDPAMQAGLQELKAGGVDQLVDQIIEGYFLAQARAAKTTKPPTGGSKAPKQAKAEQAPTTRPASRAECIKLLDAKRQARVMDLLQQIVKLFPQSPTAARARADLDALLADEAFMKKLAAAEAGREVKRAFSKAENYRRAGLADKAIELYKQVIEKFPDTPQAKRAAEQIRALQIQAASP